MDARDRVLFRPALCIGRNYFRTHVFQESMNTLRRSQLCWKPALELIRGETCSHNWDAVVYFTSSSFSLHLALPPFSDGPSPLWGTSPSHNTSSNCLTRTASPYAPLLIFLYRFPTTLKQSYMSKPQFFLQANSPPNRTSSLQTPWLPLSTSLLPLMNLPHLVGELTWFPHWWKCSNPFLSWSQPSSSHLLYFIFC